MDASTLHQDLIVFDGHCDTVLSIGEGKRSFSERSTEGHIDLPRLGEGGVTAQVFASFIEDQYLPAGAAKQTLRLFDALLREIDKNGSSLVLATKARQIEKAKQAALVAAVMAIEGAESLEGDLALLRVFYRLGLRLLTVAWSRRNQAADGIMELRTGGGLTCFGVKLVEECNRLGILLDVSHLTPPGVKDVLQFSTQPIVASHSNAYALCPSVRNLTDEQLAALAEKDGLVAVTFVPAFVVADGRGATLEKVLDHVDHIVRVAGIDHVGFGSDFDGFDGKPPAGLEDASRAPALTAGLLVRGYTPDQIRKIMGGNWMRVFRQVVG